MKKLKIISLAVTMISGIGMFYLWILFVTFVIGFGSLCLITDKEKEYEERTISV